MGTRPINKGIDEKLFNDIIAINKTTPYHRLLGLNVSMLDKGVAELKIVVKKEYLNPAGNAHGGMLFSVFDSVLGASIRTLGNYDITSLSANMSFIAPAKPGDTLTFTGKAVHIGRSTAVAEGRVYNQDDKLIATCSETFFNFGKLDNK